MSYAHYCCSIEKWRLLKVNTVGQLENSWGINESKSGNERAGTMSEILCVGHALKEVLSAGECLAALENGVRQSGDKVDGSFLLSDGGDGFLDACGRLREMEIREVDCTAPLGDAITAPFLYDEEAQTAYIEMAQCSGLKLVEPVRRNVMISGTAGLGDLIAAARNAGARKIYIGLGGSATCDGGLGMLWKLVDHAGLCQPGACEVRVALDLPDSPSPDIDALKEWFSGVELIAMADVDNPLMGPNGAAKVFGPQKGSDPEQIEQLDGWMGDWCDRVQRNAGTNLCGAPATGAAGGVGFALAVLGAELVPGAVAMCEMTGLALRLNSSSVMLTAEGRFDDTSFGGKAPWVASRMALERNAQPVIFCGTSDDNAARSAKEAGVTVVEFGADIPPDERVNRSAEALADCVAGYLKGGAAVTV